MRAQPLEVKRLIDGTDEQRRSHFPMNDFAEEEYGTFMDTLFYYWQSMRMPHSLIPMVSSFRPWEIFSEADMERYHGVDVRPVEPPNFVMREHPGGKVADRCGNISDRPISQFPSRIHAEACSADYNLCRTLGFPQYHEVDQIVCGYSRRYRRLLLPLTDEKGKIVRLAYVVRLLEPVARVF